MLIFAQEVTNFLYIVLFASTTVADIKIYITALSVVRSIVMKY